MLLEKKNIKLQLPYKEIVIGENTRKALGDLTLDQQKVTGVEFNLSLVLQVHIFQ